MVTREYARPFEKKGELFLCIARNETKRPRSGHLVSNERIRNKSKSHEVAAPAKQEGFMSKRNETKRPRSGHLVSNERIRNKSKSHEVAAPAKQEGFMSKRNETKRPRSGHKN